MDDTLSKDLANACADYGAEYFVTLKDERILIGLVHRWEDGKRVRVIPKTADVKSLIEDPIPIEDIVKVVRVVPGPTN